MKIPHNAFSYDHIPEPDKWVADEGCCKALLRFITFGRKGWKKACPWWAQEIQGLWYVLRSEEDWGGTVGECFYGNVSVIVGGGFLSKEGAELMIQSLEGENDRRKRSL